MIGKSVLYSPFGLGTMVATRTWTILPSGIITLPNPSGMRTDLGPAPSTWSPFKNSAAASLTTDLNPNSSSANHPSRGSKNASNLDCQPSDARPASISRSRQSPSRISRAIISLSASPLDIKMTPARIRSPASPSDDSTFRSLRIEITAAESTGKTCSIFLASRRVTGIYLLR